MDYVNDILARLQRGEDVGAIASDLTKSINEANIRYQAEQEAKRKAEEEAALKAAAAEVSRNEKIRACESFLDALYEIAVAWDLDDDILNEIDHYDAAELANQLDELILVFQKYAELMGMLRADNELISPVRQAPVGDRVANPIEDFLNKYVR